MSPIVSNLLIAIPALPLLATIVTALFGRRLGERSHLPIVVALVAAFLASFLLVAEVAKEAGESELSEDEQRRFARVAGDYVALLRTHIREEDEVVYPIARARIRPAAWDEVERECAEIDAERRDEVAALLEIAERLSGTFR